MKEKLNQFLSYFMPLAIFGFAIYFLTFHLEAEKKSPKNFREISSEEKATPYSFGGSCSSQGSWTAAALAQTSTIKNVITALKDDPNCKGIETVVNQLQTVESSFGAPEQKDDSPVKVAHWEGLPADIHALRSLGSISTSRTKDVLSLLMGKTLDNAVLSQYKGLAIRSDRVARTGIRFVNQTLDVLPNFNRCLVNRPNQAVALMGGILKLTSAFASSGENVVGDLGNTLSKLATFMRDNKFTKALAGLDEAELWMSMSCLTETTTEAYCSARDNLMLLNYAKQNEVLMNESEIENGSLEGYFILIREVPIISRWLQKVQFGAKPRFVSDTIPKNSTIASFATFQQAQYLLVAKYEQSMDLIRNEPDNDKKKLLIHKMIFDLADAINDGSEEGQRMNFYNQAIGRDLVPFYLIGRNKIPDECLGRMPMAPSDYMKGDGIPRLPEFSDPMDLAQKIGDRLNLLNEEAAVTAGRVYQNRVIVDYQNLVDETVSGQTIDVYQSLQHISSYLGKLIKNIQESRKNLIQLASIVDTKKRVDDVLAVYKQIEEKVSTYLEMKEEINTDADKSMFENSIAKDQELKALYPKLVLIAAEKFNVPIQKDSFLPQRIATYVQKDFALKIQDKKNITQDQQEILITATEGIIGRLNSAYKQNPNDVVQDLTKAQIVNKKNIDTIEEIFGDNIVDAIQKTKSISEGEQSVARNKVRDSIKPFTDMIYYSLWLDKIKTPKTTINRNKTQEDANGSFGKFRSMLCIQAMAFKDQSKFRALCEGVKLEPYMYLTEKDARTLNILKDQLSVDYDKSLIEKMSYLSNHGKNSMRDMNICAYRNYRRANYAYWLIKDFSSNRFSSGK